jgi:crotonobetainyl-CoA:carnitine CoA-transferase CaiB-like acyl-CoA transferase
LPFYVIKLRRAVKNARNAKQRKVLAGQMNALLEELMEAAGEGLRSGVLNETDWKELTDHTERLLRAFYIGYTEFKETDDMLKDRILTYSQELVLQARKETQREDAKYYREQKKKVVERTVRKTRMETAKKMKEMKIPMRQIASVSGLPLNEIKKL